MAAGGTPIRISVLFEGNTQQNRAAIDQAAKQLETRFTSAAHNASRAWQTASQQIQTALNGINRLAGRVPFPGGAGGYGGFGHGGGIGGFGGIGPGGAAFGPFGYYTASANQAHQSIGRLSSSLIKLGLVVYTTRTLGRLFRSAFVDPFLEAGDAILRATELQRKFATSISTVVGGQNRARAITQSLVASARNSPMTSAELMEAGRSAAFVPGMAGRYSFGSTDAVAARFKDYAELLKRLAIFDPQQGIQGAGIATREFLSGNAQSIRRRLEVSPQSIADAIGKRLTEVLADPAVAHRALQTFASIYVGSAAFAGQQELLSNATAKLYDQLSQGAAVVGQRGGFYDATTDRIRGLTDLLADSFDPAKNPRFLEQSKRISDSLTRMLDNVFGGVSSLINRFAPGRNPIDSAAEAMTRLFEAAAAVSDALPTVGASLGEIGGATANLIRQIYSAATGGFSANVNVAGFNVPISMGSAGEISRIKSRIAELNARYGERSDWDIGAGRVPDEYRQMIELRRRLSELESGNAPNPVQKALAGMQALYFADLAKPYRTQRQVREAIESRMSGISGRVAVQSITGYVGAAGKDFEYQPDYELLAERVRAIPSQIRELFREGGENALSLRGVAGGYPQLLAGAERDLHIARIARGLPAGGTIGPMTLGNLSGITRTGTLGGELDSALGSVQSNAFFAELLQDRQGQLEAVRRLPERIKRELELYAGAFADSLRELPAGAGMNDRVLKSVQSLADQISDSLELPPEAAQELRNAMNSAPESLKRFIARAGYESQLRAAELGLPAELPGSADELVRRIKSANVDDGVLQTHEAYQAQLRTTYDNLVSRGGLADTSELTTDLRATAEEIARVQRAINDFRGDQFNDQMRKMQDAVQDFAAGSRGAIENGLGDVFYDLIAQTGDAEDSVRRMSQNILREFTQMQARLLMQGLFGDMGQPQANGGIGGAGGLFGAVLGIGANFLSGLFGGGINQYGGVGSVPYGPAFPGRASGGPVTGGMPYIVGEAGKEVFVPTTSGSIIPNHMISHTTTGRTTDAFDMRPEIKVFNVRNDEEAWARGYDAHRDIIVGDVMRNPHVRKRLGR